MTKPIYYLILNKKKIHVCCNENMQKCPSADALCLPPPSGLFPSSIPDRPRMEP